MHLKSSFVVSRTMALDLKQMFNSTTHVGRRNVSIATLGSIAAIVIYKKMTKPAASTQPPKKV